jgi:hypothetical protein
MAARLLLDLKFRCMFVHVFLFELPHGIEQKMSLIPISDYHKQDYCGA